MLNKCFIMGRLTKDVELRKTQNGNAVATMTVAVDRNGKDAGTDFIDVVAWKQTAEFAAKYLAKGRMVVVDGRLQSRKWADKNGNNRVAWEVVADNVYFFGGRRENTADEHDAGPQMTEVEDDGELPF